MPLNTGQILNNRYRIVKLLGQGGFGAVYRAWDINLKGPCAIKENFETTPAAQAQFGREASMLYNLRHSNLPKVIDNFSIPGQGQYLVMEYIEGQDLGELLVQSGSSLPETQIIPWIMQICDALTYLHNRKPPIIHRDLKPANIRITPEGSAVLVDFGIAKIYDPEQRTTLGARAVTPGFSPFEQYGQKVTDARTDVYAMGATLYFLLTGQEPPESIERISGTPLPAPRDLNPKITLQTEAVLLKSLALMPEDRYQTIVDLKDALSLNIFSPSQVSIAPTRIEPSTAMVDLSPQPKRRTWKVLLPWFILFGLVCVGFAILSTVVLGNYGPDIAKLGFISGSSPTPTIRPTVTLRSTSTIAPTNIPAPAVVCEDTLGCVKVAQGFPIRIASALVISGPNADLGKDSQFGVEIAIDFKEEIFGHSIELQAFDDRCSAEGGQTAGQKIVSDPSIVAVVGTSCSSAGVPMSKVVSDAGYVMVSPSNTYPVLTDPDFHEAGYLRTAHNDKVQGIAMADFAYNKLGARKAAAIHDGDSYTEELARVFAGSFEELGGEISAFTAVNKGDTDMRPVLTAVAAAGPPDFLYYPVFTAEGGFLTQQAKEVAGLENTILSAADGMISEAAIEAVGDAGEGMYFSGPDLSFSGEAYDRFIAKYEDKYGQKPLSVFHAHAFDAANMIFACVEKVGIQEENGTLHIGRQAMRDCLYATNGYQGITGILTCDSFGDCGGTNIIVSQLQNGQYIRIWP